MSLSAVWTVIDMADGSRIQQAVSFDLTDGTLLSTIADSWRDPDIILYLQHPAVDGFTHTTPETSQ